MNILTIKALHIIFVVTWFAGLIYIVRLFIYHVEAEELEPTARKILQDQYKIMQRRLWYGITYPSAVLVLIFGGLLLKSWLPLSNHPWLGAKLGLVFLLYCYHFYCGHIYQCLKQGKKTLSATSLRYWNEVATLFLFSIVFLVELKNILKMGQGVLGLMALGLLLALGIRFYRKVTK